jgi:hypothetical protein
VLPRDGSTTLVNPQFIINAWLTKRSDACLNGATGKLSHHPCTLHIALCKERLAMMGLLVTSRAQIDEQQMRLPLLPGFVRRALLAIFRKH